MGPDRRHASLVALSYGTGDAQKTMGVIALALITGRLTWMRRLQRVAVLGSS